MKTVKDILEMIYKKVKSIIFSGAIGLIIFNLIIILLSKFLKVSLLDKYYTIINIIIFIFSGVLYLLFNLIGKVKN